MPFRASATLDAALDLRSVGVFSLSLGVFAIGVQSFSFVAQA